ncbi:hypothetical protein AZE42_11698 [Rhizopogon vesiculosus]|uniref:Uncharacterized protein n=1 Tax=Rhizopogon vesiculosus TaxID=180088 RepID=A0A1J8QGF8_9AGAM|nr:hypothetical protein AZE42_11698 [Rhizopogon vesiculosus]
MTKGRGTDRGRQVTDKEGMVMVNKDKDKDKEDRDKASSSSRLSADTHLHPPVTTHTRTRTNTRIITWLRLQHRLRRAMRLRLWVVRLVEEGVSLEVVGVGGVGAGAGAGVGGGGVIQLPRAPFEHDARVQGQGKKSVLSIGSIISGV